MASAVVDLRFGTLWRLLGWILLVCVVYFSLHPRPPNIGLHHPGGDKLAHLVAHATLMWWFVQARGGHRPAAWGLFLFTVGILIEIAQGWVATRRPELLDIFANSVGLAVGYVLLLTPARNAFAWTEGKLFGRLQLSVRDATAPRCRPPGEPAPEPSRTADPKAD